MNWIRSMDRVRIRENVFLQLLIVTAFFGYSFSKSSNEMRHVCNCQLPPNGAVSTEDGWFLASTRGLEYVERLTGDSIWLGGEFSGVWTNRGKVYLLGIDGRISEVTVIGSKLSLMPQITVEHPKKSVVAYISHNADRIAVGWKDVGSYKFEEIVVLDYAMQVIERVKVPKSVFPFDFDCKSSRLLGIREAAGKRRFLFVSGLEDCPELNYERGFALAKFFDSSRFVFRINNELRFYSVVDNEIKLTECFEEVDPFVDFLVIGENVLFYRDQKWFESKDGVVVVDRSSLFGTSKDLRAFVNDNELLVVDESFRLFSASMENKLESLTKIVGPARPTAVGKLGGKLFAFTIAGELVEIENCRNSSYYLSRCPISARLIRPEPGCRVKFTNDCLFVPIGADHSKYVYGKDGRLREEGKRKYTDLLACPGGHVVFVNDYRNPVKIWVENSLGATTSEITLGEGSARTISPVIGAPNHIAVQVDNIVTVLDTSNNLRVIRKFVFPQELRLLIANRDGTCLAQDVFEDWAAVFKLTFENDRVSKQFPVFLDRSASPNIECNYHETSNKVFLRIGDSTIRSLDAQDFKVESSQQVPCFFVAQTLVLSEEKLVCLGSDGKLYQIEEQKNE